MLPGAMDGEAGAVTRGGRKKAVKKAKAKESGAGGVVAHLRPADLSGVDVESEALAGAVVYFFNCGRSGRSKPELEALVKRLGGTVRRLQGCCSCPCTGRCCMWTACVARCRLLTQKERLKLLPPCVG